MSQDCELVATIYKCLNKMIEGPNQDNIASILKSLDFDTNLVLLWYMEVDMEKSGDFYVEQ